MSFHVDSEVGALHQVIVHRPGLELTRLTPAQRRRPALRRRDVGAARPGGARRVRPEAARQGRQGPPVRRPARAGPGRARGPRVRPGRAHHRDPVRARPGRAAGRAGRLDAGRPLAEVLDRRRAQARPRPVERPPACSWSTSSRTTSCSRRCPTTCSSATTPPGSTTGCRSTRCRSRRASGRRSTRRLVYNFHPMFRDADPPVHFYYGNDNRGARPGELRGRRHPRHRQRRGDDRHGGADHARRAWSSWPGSTSRTAR